MAESEDEKNESKPTFGYMEEKAKLDLSPIDAEILLLAEGAGGNIDVMEGQQNWVRAGGKNFVDNNDGAVAAQGLASLERLMSYGLVVHRSGQSYVLTDAGWRIARVLRQEG